VLAHAPLSTISRLISTRCAPGWQVVVSDTQANALAEVTQSTKVASLVGLLTLALVVLAPTAMARLVTRPIEALTIDGRRHQRGELDQQASQLARSGWSPWPKPSIS